MSTFSFYHGMSFIFPESQPVTIARVAIPKYQETNINSYRGNEPVISDTHLGPNCLTESHAG